MKYLNWVLLLLTPVSALANQCDCQKVVGQCVGVIELVKSYGSKPSFGADIVVHSSAKSCSKVEYFVSGTPYQTLLVNTQQESDSLFGTSPITAKDLSFKACYVCANVDSSAQATEKSVATDISGHWVGSQCPGAPGWWGGSPTPIDLTMDLHTSGSAVSGTLALTAPTAAQASLQGNQSANVLNLTSSFGSTHKIQVSSDGTLLSDSWCNKDGGCSTCQMHRQ